MAGLHDAVASTSDDHHARVSDGTAELARHRVVRIGRRCARAAEDRDLAGAAIGIEDAVGMAHFLERSAHELELTGVGAVGNELES